jgi:hypothetical protein
MPSQALQKFISVASVAFVSFVLFVVKSVTRDGAVGAARGKWCA